MEGTEDGNKTAESSGSDVQTYLSQFFSLYKKKATKPPATVAKAISQTPTATGGGITAATLYEKAMVSIVVKTQIAILSHHLVDEPAGARSYVLRQAKSSTRSP